MSGLWTPSGDQVPDPIGDYDDVPDAAAFSDGALEDREVAEELRRVRAEISATPAVDIIANHAVGLWQLAVLHLSPDEGEPLRLDEAALAIDAMAGIVEGLGDRLGDHASALRDAVSQLRMAFVELRNRAGE